MHILKTNTCPFINLCTSVSHHSKQQNTNTLKTYCNAVCQYDPYARHAARPLRLPGGTVNGLLAFLPAPAVNLTLQTNRE